MRRRHLPEDDLDGEREGGIFAKMVTMGGEKMASSRR
jgi:hypothetical protein